MDNRRQEELTRAVMGVGMREQAYRLVEDPTCRFCSGEKESFLHLSLSRIGETET